MPTLLPFLPLQFFHSLPRFVRTLIILTAVLLLYGYLCRLVNIYFFWESKTLGWIVFFITAIPLLFYSIQLKRSRNKSSIPEKIGIGICILCLVIKGILFFGTPQTSAYDSALKFIHTSWYIKDQVGKVNSVIIEPYGSVAMSYTASGEAGETDLYFLVKGDKGYMDVNLIMVKDFDTDWQIELEE